MNTITPKFRVSYPNVFESKLNEMSGKEEFSLVALFQKGADLSTLQNAATAAIEKKWGKDKKKWPKNLKTPFRDQGEKAKETDDGKEILPGGYEKGASFITIKSMEQPGIVDSKNQAIIEPREFYAGCWARASVSCYAYEVKGNAGIAFGLRNIQKLADGEPLGGRARPEDEFQAVDTEETSNPASIFG